MGKTNHQEKVKRYSKISNALKSFFFKLIYVKEFTIKESARICRLNYSTAKAIIRDLTAKEKDYIQIQISKSRLFKKTNQAQNFQRSDYRETLNSSENQVSPLIFGHMASYHGLMVPRPIKKINIVSTTGYDFLQSSTIKLENQY